MFTLKESFLSPLGLAHTSFSPVQIMMVMRKASMPLMRLQIVKILLKTVANDGKVIG